MKSINYRILPISAIILLGIAAFSFAQTPEIRTALESENKLLADSGSFFREALLEMQQNRRPESGEKFDRAVEVFLYSTLNVKSSERLQSCYSQMLETVYRLEFPSDAQPPQLRQLSNTCGWQWNEADFKLADDVSLIVKASRQKKPVEKSSGAGVSDTAPATLAVGFNTQIFEGSPLDELSRLELTAEEQMVDGDPEARTQYEYIQFAVANKSLGFSFQVHPMIQQFINYYRGRGRKTMEVGLYRSGMFMRMARRIFREEGVPENVAWLGQVESAWKPTALSWAAASGLWQFIPGTGSRYGLRRTAHVDERNSFDEATRASARYLKFLADRYNGNWELALAAYNSGEGNVDRAIRRAGESNFWVAYPYLPRETRNYVPNILATILIANNPGQYGFGHVRPAPPLQYDRIKVPASTNLSLIAQAADTNVQFIRYLNPHLRSNVSPPEPYIINVPPGKGGEIVAVLKRMPSPKFDNVALASSTHGDTWQSIANRTGVSVEDLMAANPGMKEPRGKVFVPAASVSGNKVQATNYSRPTGPSAAKKSTGSFKIVKAQSGDTVKKLAERNGADPTVVAKYNGLFIGSPLGAGREIKIPAK